LEHLNDTTVWWLANVADVRVHSETKERPSDRHAQEVPHLLPLPAHAYEVAPVVYRHVSAEGLVVWQANRYSVPWRLIGRLLAVRITAEELSSTDPTWRKSRGIVCCRRTRRDSAASSRSTSRSPTTVSAALPWKNVLSNSVRKGRASWRGWCRPVAVYRQADVQAALERATRFGAFSASAVQRILSATARPKPVLEVLAEEERRRLDPLLRADPVTPRPLSAYQHLTRDADAETSETSNHPTTGNSGDGPSSTPPGGPGSPESGGGR
jgi:hypothetical protein